MPRLTIVFKFGAARLSVACENRLVGRAEQESHSSLVDSIEGLRDVKTGPVVVWLPGGIYSLQYSSAKSIRSVHMVWKLI